MFMRLVYVLRILRKATSKGSNEPACLMRTFLLFTTYFRATIDKTCNQINTHHAHCRSACVWTIYACFIGGRKFQIQSKKVWYF